MNNVCCIHLHDVIDPAHANAIREELRHIPFVVHVDGDIRSTQDLTVEFEPHHNVPMSVLLCLESHHLHPDMLGC